MLRKPHDSSNSTFLTSVSATGTKPSPKNDDVGAAESAATARLLRRKTSLPDNTEQPVREGGPSTKHRKGGIHHRCHGSSSSSSLSGDEEGSAADEEDMDDSRWRRLGLGPTLQTVVFPGLEDRPCDEGSRKSTHKTLPFVMAHASLPLRHEDVQQAIRTVLLAEPPCHQVQFNEATKHFVEDIRFVNIVVACVWWGIYALRLRATPLDPKKTADVTTTQDSLFHSAAMTYGDQFESMPYPRSGTMMEHKDSILSLIPLLLSKTAFYLTTLSFQTTEDEKKFDHSFRGSLLRTFTEWITGIVPQQINTNG